MTPSQRRYSNIIGPIVLEFLHSLLQQLFLTIFKHLVLILLLKHNIARLVLQGNEYVQSVCRCLQMLLRIEPYRDAFYSLDGVVTLVQVSWGLQGR